MQSLVSYSLFSQYFFFLRLMFLILISISTFVISPFLVLVKPFRTTASENKSRVTNRNWRAKRAHRLRLNAEFYHIAPSVNGTPRGHVYVIRVACLERTVKSYSYVPLSLQHKSPLSRTLAKTK
jgi:hypothetical protein